MRIGVFNFLAQDRVHFGVSAAEGIAAEVAQRGAKRLYVVTKRSLNRNTAAVTAALATVKDRVVGLFDECIEHTPRVTVIALTRRLRETQADLIVSIGAGTVIDTVKVALVCLAEGVDDVDGMSAWHMRVSADGSRHTPRPRLPPCIRRTDCGASHGLGHALGADCGVPHGITSCVPRPTVMRYNAEVCKPQLAEVAAALGDATRPAADQIEALIARLGLPTRISQLGIQRSRLATIAEKGMAIPWVRNNPRKIERVAQLVEILEAAW